MVAGGNFTEESEEVTQKNIEDKGSPAVPSVEVPGKCQKI